MRINWKEVFFNPRWFFVAVLVLVLVFWIGWSRFYSEQKILVTPPPDLTIKTYSLSGEAVSAEADKVRFIAGLVYQKKSGNVVEFEERIALITPQTQLTRLVKENNNYKSVPIQLSDIRRFTKITVYYSQNPLVVTELAADKIEITE